MQQRAAQETYRKSQGGNCSVHAIPAHWNLPTGQLLHLLDSRRLLLGHNIGKGTSWTSASFQVIKRFCLGNWEDFSFLHACSPLCAGSVLKSLSSPDLDLSCTRESRLLFEQKVVDLEAL